jgi:Tfp pilus assembly protein PilE
MRTAGFQMVELIILGSILAVLMTVAVPLYAGYKRDKEIQNGQSESSRFFAGRHELLNLEQTVHADQDVYVCLDSGSVDFTWKNNRGEWVQSQFQKNRVRYDFSTTGGAFCKFRWFAANFKEGKWTDNVVYVVLCCPQSTVVSKKPVQAESRSGW